MTADYEKLRQEETDKSSKLQELMSVPKSNKQKSKQNKSSSSPNNIINNNKNNSNATTPTNRSPSRIINCLSSPKKQLNYSNSNPFFDEFDIDEQNFNKIRKNFFNSNAQCYHNHHHNDFINDDDTIDDHHRVYSKLSTNNDASTHNNNNTNNTNDTNSKSLISTLYRTIPLALPTLQLHLLISLTMVLLTHRCPQYLIVL